MEDVDGAVVAFPHRSSSIPSPPTTSSPVTEGEKRNGGDLLQVILAQKDCNKARELNSAQA
ncbi:hypothetical protein F2Q69_00027286 [Brassica cretica]|uniref:Uncharacterized protein n=1 Tax=Brassica cretica TaxID=69181 RepID=A0A8S9S5R5_BRACR|nr:hypothetical protein F2Q69_00027286 [Brassica cretica]